MRVPWSTPRFEPLTPLPTALGKAVRGRDWAAVEQYFAALPTGTDPTWSAIAASKINGSDTFFRDAVNRTGGSGLALTLLGTRLVEVGWRHRGYRMARYTTNDQFRLFHEYLTEAEQVLADATAVEPDSVAAWSVRLQTNRALNLGQDEQERRYLRAAAAQPHPLFAQMQHIQGMCPKWGGTFERVHVFAAASAAEAPDGTPHGALVADGHVEHMVTLRTSYTTYGQRPEVRDEVIAAAARSVWRTDDQTQPGWLWAHSMFAVFFALSGLHQDSARHLRVLGRRADERAWSRVSARPTEIWLRARRLARV